MTEQPILRDTVRLAADTAADLFVEVDGSLPAAGANAYGPTYMGGKTGEAVAVTTLGIATVTAGAAIARGVGVMVTAAGKVITHAGNAPVVARALEAAAADGDRIRAHLIPN